MMRFVLAFSLMAFFGLPASLERPLKSDDPNPKKDPNMPLKREFRGVWVASVTNIDWPSKPGLTTAEQKQELIRILDEHQRTGINAVMLQIRPATDALYGKSREMWSRFLTGKQGTAPSPFYDPLTFAIEESHKRGIELHAWFNPYRATFDLVSANTHPEHITRQKPNWFFTYAGKQYFNPGIPEVQDYIVDVIMDVVKNYDIDGVHFDDYFYPYPGSSPLPDQGTFAKYGSKFRSIEDWRRANVDSLIRKVSENIRREKKFVKFGISPFGIWQNRSNHPEGSQSNGLEGYSKLYADARKWLKEDWIDYINPQLYFAFNYPAAPYEKLVDWWANNAYGKHVYIGQAAYRSMENRQGWENRRQLPDQIRYLRQNNRVQGSVFFSSKSLTNNLAGFQDSLRRDFYRYPSLPPVMDWIDRVAPNAPQNLVAKVQGNAVQLSWQKPLKASDGDLSSGYVIYRAEGPGPVDTEDARNILRISFESNLSAFTDNSVRPGKQYTYVITALDRIKNESLPVVASVKLP